MDRRPTQTQGVRTAALLGAPAPAPVVKAASTGRRVVVRAPAPVAPPPAPKVYTVETIRGAKRAEEVIR
jgi:hypothetical protein